MTNSRLLSIYTVYNFSPLRTLSDVYRTYSTEKFNAYVRCINDMRAHNGQQLSVIVANCHLFTVGYTYKIGNEKHFVYITKSNRYDIIV